MLLGLPDPDPLIRGRDPDPEKPVNKGVGSGVGSGSRTGSGVGSISQRYGSGSGSAPKCHGSPTLLKTNMRSLVIL
jgi:hypothetical protein